MSSLKRTSTNSGKETKGRVLGFDGMLYFPVILSVIISLFVCSSAFSGCSGFIKVFIGFAPSYLTIAYIICFFVNKPPKYQTDVLDELLYGKHFNTNGLKKVRWEMDFKNDH